MKTKFLLAAALLMGSATLATAQTTPTSPQYGGTVNQTTVPPINPANPTTNPGTIDQRAPTSTTPTQQGVLGTIDQTPLPQRPATAVERDMRQTTPASPVTPGTMRRSTRQNTAPRSMERRTNRTTTPATTVPRP